MKIYVTELWDDTLGYDSSFIPLKFYLTEEKAEEAIDEWMNQNDGVYEYWGHVKECEVVE